MSKTKHWINFCGVSSESIAGLLINELPAIQMTPKRINKIEIEGRDGDIIEELGYMAYDKPVQISLTVGFDVDQVISWLNNSGPIIFSNEPNKVYTATVYDTVSFERLVRFRKANIKFHVQPFKTLLNDEISFDGGYLKNITVTNKGNIYSRPVIVADIGTTSQVTIIINDEYVHFFFNKEEGKTYTATFNLESNEITVTDNTGEKVTLTRVIYSMLGDFFELQPGANTITVERYGSLSSDISAMTIKNASRWL